MALEIAKKLLENFDNYAEQHPSEVAEVKKFKDFILRNVDNSVYSRTNFDGHLTSSAFLVNTEKTQVLLLHHKKLNRWLQPGGHIDPTDDSILEAAKREVCEEVGLQPIDFLIYEERAALFFDIDAHVIPENTKKNEPEHTHFDIRFLFILKPDVTIFVNKEEANGFKWVSFEEMQIEKEFIRIAEKLKFI